MELARQAGLFAVLAATLSFSPQPVNARDFLADTYLIDLFVGSHRSTLAKNLGKGGFELATGEFFSLEAFYTPKFPQVSVLFLHQLSPSFGIIWGVGTGESAPKYKIQPSIYLGFLVQEEVFDNAFLSLKAVYPVGGRLSEYSCSGDFGEIGGIQEVNCRLAADILAPSETLNLLAQVSSEIDASVSLGFDWRF